MRVRIATVMCAIFIVCDLFGQETATSTLQGVAYDSSRSVLPNAEVSLVNNATGFRRSVNTAAEGDYIFTLVPAGVYEVTMKASGFATAQFPNVELRVGASTRLDAMLSLSAVEQEVTVEAQVTQSGTTKTAVGLSITPTEVQGLPLNGRDFANLAFLAPGTKPVNSYDPTKNRVAVFATNGSAGRNVNVTVNGIDDKDNTVGGPVMQLPLEAVEEFNISTQRFSAANGRTSGSAINLITRSGTNNYHGSLFLLERDTSLNAKDYFTAQTGQPTSPFSRQQYGGSFGMPIV